MHRRASAKLSDPYYWQNVSFYDGQNVGFSNLGHATNLSLRFCERYQNANLTITELAELAKKELTKAELNYQVNLQKNHQTEITNLKNDCDNKIFYARIWCLVFSLIIIVLGFTFIK